VSKQLQLSCHIKSYHIISYQSSNLQKIAIIIFVQKNTRLSLNQLHVKKEYINFFFCFEILPVLK